MTIYRACEIILLPGDFASAVFLPSLSKFANTKGRKMKIEIFTEGIGRVIASGYAMRNCISFLKSVYPKRFRWIKKDGIDFDMIYAVNYELRDKWIKERKMSYAIQKQWKQRLQTLREKSVAEINFIDALDSVITRDEYRSLTDDQQRELIQAWLYPDNNEIDELTEEIPTDVHYEPNHPNLSENNEVQDLTSIEFFVANVKSYHASVFGVYCSNCFESESTLAVTTNNYTMFEFCKPCYDKLKRAMIARDARS